MEFHVGNGITLSKEEENLPDAQREELIRQKRAAQEEAERAAEAARKEVAEAQRGHAGDADKALAAIDDIGARTYWEDGEEAAGARKGGKEPSGGLPDGTFGVRRNEDFTQYRKERAERRARARAAKEAALAAQREQRDALLASGRYFDNGRGKVMLKKEYRQYMAGDRRHGHLRTAADDGTGMASIRRAGADAWEAALVAQAGERADGALAYTQSAVRMNREAAEERRRARATEGVRDAERRLSVFDGFAAALDALRADASDKAGASDNFASVWGGKDAKGRDARWRYGEDGKIIGQADAREAVDGRRLASGAVQKRGEDGMVRGFVSPNVIKAINSQLKGRGADYALTGIMARQPYGELGEPVKGTEPMFYVQGMRNDGSQFGQYMTMRDVYDWGVRNYRAANGEFGKADGAAENFAIRALGGYDPDGVLERAARSDRVEVAKINAASREKIADQREKGRQARATLRDNQAWAKLAVEQAKVDNNLAIQMKKADTYGKRVDLIEQKIKNDYEIQMKRAKTDEERQKAEATYKERRADIEEGNLDLGWFKAEASAEQGQQKIDNDRAQKEADRQLRRELAELRALANQGVTRRGSAASADALKSIQHLQKILDGGNLTEENRKSIKDRMNGIAADLDADKATVKSGDNSGDETARQEPPNGQYKVEKDGISYHWGKSKSGKWGYFPDK